MKVSVILSYFRQPEILEKTLHIWTNQTFDHDEYEILIMDGGNDPEGIKIYKEYKEKFPNLRYFTYDGHVDYKCPVHSWNVAFKQAKGDIIIVTMEDRLTTFDAVEALYRPHEKNKNIFCTVLPYLCGGRLEDKLIDTIDWRKNPKLFWSIAVPTTIATKERDENETVMYSIPREKMLELKGFDERWRDYAYWMLELRKNFIDAGLIPWEVSWIINMHHHHGRNGTMQQEKYDRQARIYQWNYIKSLNKNEGIDWGAMEGSQEI
jgi:glycosyltransferase involved in cell wall biosynthesis